MAPVARVDILALWIALLIDILYSLYDLLDEKNIYASMATGSITTI